MATNPKTVEATSRVFTEFRDRHGLDGDGAWKAIDRALAAFLIERTGRIDSELQHMPTGARLGALIDTYGADVVANALERSARGELVLPERNRDGAMHGWGIVSADGAIKSFGSPEGAMRAFITAPDKDGLRVFHEGQVVVDRDPESGMQPLFVDADVARIFGEVEAALTIEVKKKDRERMPAETVPAPVMNAPEPDAIHFFELLDKPGAEDVVDAIVGIVGPSASASHTIDATSTHDAAGPDKDVDAIRKGLDKAIEGESTATATDANGKRKDLGPLTLQNGCFERDEAGQYRRVGEEKISLVDEGLRIRMIDKQEDAFLASIELAASKGWKTIEVTGSEKFRAEAWLNSKLAGFEVVGYTPTELDLVALEGAREGKGLVATSEALGKSKAAAEAVAKVKSSKVADADVDKGRYSGPLILVTEHHAVQDIGRKTAVVHELKKLPQAEVERALTGKRNLSVEYKDGIVFAKARAPLAKSNER